MNLITSIKFKTNGNWTAPAGVTEVLLSSSSLSSQIVSVYPVTVVPFTTYVISLSSSASTFGSLYSWYHYDVNVGFTYLTVNWIE